MSAGRRLAEPVLLTGVRPHGEGAADLGVDEDGALAIDPGRDGWRGRVISADGLVVLPGLVDLHTHLREPGGEEAETIRTGTRAAAAGGYAAVFAMANTRPVTDSPVLVERMAGRAAETASCDVHPVGAITTGLAGNTLVDMAALAAAGVRMFSDDGHCVADAAVMRAALHAAGAMGALVAQHAQCPDLAGGAQVNEGPVAEALGVAGWPGVAESSIVARDVQLAADAAPGGARLHVCHVSTAATVEVVRWAKAQGWPVTAEVAPHHLLLTDDLARSGDTRFKVNPPLRTPADVTALRQGLADGAIDAVATDHAPHTSQAKAAAWCDAPFGMLGLETALPVVAATMVETGLMCWRDVARVMSAAPAGIGRLPAPELSTGAPATFCVVDPAAPWTVHPAELASVAENTPFAEMALPAQVVATVLRGRVTHDPRGLFGGLLDKGARPETG